MTCYHRSPTFPRRYEPKLVAQLQCNLDEIVVFVRMSRPGILMDGSLVLISYTGPYGILYGGGM